MNDLSFRGDRLKELRKARGMTQQDLADTLNLERTSIANYEGSKADPSLRVLVLIAYTFKVATDYLLDLTDRRDPSDDRPVLNFTINMQTPADFTAGEMTEVLKRGIQEANWQFGKSIAVPAPSPTPGGART